jgi:pyruvate dehydrogenase E2 component (dihydrolipoamide acetyltransferase)
MREITMPRLSVTMESGRLLRWCVPEGGEVKEGEPLLEIETDKVSQEVPAPASGVLRGIRLRPGEEAPVGAIIGYIAAPGEAWAPSPVDAATQAAEVGARAAGLASVLSPEAGKVRASPAARRVAEEHGIDLSLVKGTGPGGRIQAEDVLAFMEAQKEKPSGPVQADMGDLIAPPQIHLVMARRMTESFRDVPHFYLTMEVVARHLLELREGLLASVESRTGARLTLSDLLLKVIGLALVRHPEVNASWEDGKLRRHWGIHLGLAVAVEQGLVVPVIRDADKKSLIEIVGERKSLVEKAQSGKLTLDDISGGTFTLSNLGMYGLDLFQAIINPPQGAILAVGSVRERAVVENGAVVARPTFFMTLSVDHRVTDGAHAALFLKDLKEMLESPYPASLPD